MASKTIDKSIIDEALKLVHLTLKMRKRKCGLITARKQMCFTSVSSGAKGHRLEMTDDGILLRYKDGELVGITILEASKKINTGIRSLILNFNLAG